MPKSGLTAIKEVITKELSGHTWTETKTPPPRTRNYSTFFTAEYGICQIELEWCSNGWGSGHVVIHLKDRNKEIVGSYNLHAITDDTYKLTKEFLLQFAEYMNEISYFECDIDTLNKSVKAYYQEKLMATFKQKS